MTGKPTKTISVIGLGYVGCVSVACLAKSGFKVIGVDVKQEKVKLINSGRATIMEAGLGELVRKGVESELISATTCIEEAILSSDIILITIGTPISEDGDLDLSRIFHVAEELGAAIRYKDSFLTIAIRSTVKPGVCDEISDSIAAASGKKAGRDFSVVANPEFLREGTAIRDYFNPPFVLIGSSNGRASDELASIYSDINGKVIRSSIKIAEIIKYVNNSWHALKVTFGNEIGSICKSMGVSSQEVMDIFFEDRMLNISENYLTPGYAFGGSCLTKDLTGLVTLARKCGIDIPLLENVHRSNDAHIKRAVELIKKHGVKKVSILGISFKVGTDDVRKSPTISVIRALQEDGYDIRVYDKTINSSLQMHLNVDALTQQLGNILKLLVNSSKALVDHSTLIVVAKNEYLEEELISSLNECTIIDLVNYRGDKKIFTKYSGLAWL